MGRVLRGSRERGLIERRTGPAEAPAKNGSA
jgi:hypothetical protein